MRLYSFFLIGVFLACSSPEQSKHSENIDKSADRATKSIDSILHTAFVDMIDSAELAGCILIYDTKKNTFYSNDFNWANTGQLPASTFKIPNSIIGLELGLIIDSATIFPWNGLPQANTNWEKDLKLKNAFQLSCVPCYRELAKQIGLNNMRDYISEFGYGDMIIDSSNLDLFWLVGNSKISPFQQIDFLKTFNEKKYKLKENTYKTMYYILLREKTERFSLYGKTGWSTDNEHDNTWFVGFAETADNIFYFATNLEPTANTDMKKMAENRVDLTIEALENIGL